MRISLTLILVLLIPTALFPQSQSDDLTNADVLTMLSADISQEVIIAKIHSSEADFDTSPNALASLKAAHVPDSVILAMVQAPPPRNVRVAYVKCVGSDDVFLAASPSGGASIVKTLRCGDRVSITDDQNGWYRIRTQDGTDGYLTHSFVSDGVEKSVPVKTGPQGYVKCGVDGSEVYLLASPTGTTTVKALKCGDRLTLLDQQNGWYRVQTQDGSEGYVSHYFLADANGTSMATSAAQSASTANRVPTDTLRAIAWRAVPWVTTGYYQQPGSANTDCLGSGSWMGNTYQGSASCTTQYTPAQSVPMNWQHVTIYNLVETSNARLVIACTRNWAFSKCAYLVPGSLFRCDNHGSKISVIGEKGGKGKQEKLDYEIVSSQPVP